LRQQIAVASVIKLAADKLLAKANDNTFKLNLRQQTECNTMGNL